MAQVGFYLSFSVLAASITCDFQVGCFVPAEAATVGIVDRSECLNSETSISLSVDTVFTRLQTHESVGKA